MTTYNITDTLRLTAAQWDSQEEKARQRAIARARDYFDGKQIAYLSARLKEFLALDSVSDVDRLFHLNLCDKIINIVVERLSVTGFKSSEATQGTAQMDGQTDVAGAWAKSVWQTNRLDAKQWELYEMVRRDGEAFCIVDFLPDSELPRVLPHQRFVDATSGGDSFGCMAFYPAGDDSLPMEYATKRFAEEFTEEARQYWTDNQIRAGKRQRMTRYYPDRIEKYALERGKWEKTQDVGDVLNEKSWLDWLGKDGKPLGIPVIHFKNHGLRCEIDSSVVAMQNLLNKALIDFAESGDASAFREIVVFGFTPTSDGLPPASDGSNKLKKGPGKIWGTTKSATDASVTPIEPVSLTTNIDAINAIIRWIAFLKDIPASRIQFTGQVASEGTQKQQDAALLSVVGQLQVTLGDAWEDTMYLARKLANTFGGQGLSEEMLLETQWKSPEVRADDRDDPTAFWAAAAVAVGQVGVPFSTFARRYGWSDQDLAGIDEDLEVARLMASFDRGQGIGGDDGKESQANN